MILFYIHLIAGWFLPIHSFHRYQKDSLETVRILERPGSPDLSGSTGTFNSMELPMRTNSFGSLESTVDVSDRQEEGEDKPASARTSSEKTIKPEKSIKHEKSINSEKVISQILEELISEMSDEELETNPEVLEEFGNELRELAEYPLDLNNCTQEDLQQFLFLTEDQIESILYYRYKEGGFSHKYEIQLLPGFDHTDMMQLLPFIDTGNKKELYRKLSFQEIIREGRSEIISFSGRSLQKKKGYFPADNTGPAYAGDPWHVFGKFKFNYKNKYRFSFTLDKDSGEPLSPVPDFNSFSFSLKRKGMLEEVIAGDYKMGFGQGLVINQGFGRGKSTQFQQTFSRRQGIQPASSTNEYNFLRGMALKARFGSYTGWVFASFRKLDADTSEARFTSLYKTGYHRTVHEIAKKNSLDQTCFGAILLRRWDLIEIGTIFSFMHFDTPMESMGKPYQLFHFTGQNLGLNSVFYRFKLFGFHFYGENSWSLDRTGFGSAHLFGLHFSPVTGLELNAHLRHYNRSYHSFFTSSIGESSSTRNETAAFIGLNWQLSEKLILQAYADSYRFPWLKFGVDAPSNGQEIRMNLDYRISSDWTVRIRLKSEIQELNLKTDDLNQKRLGNSDRNSLKFESKYNQGPLELSAGIEMNNFIRTGEERSWGIASWQDAAVNVSSLKLKISLRYAFFNLTSFNNRIYLYEPDVYQQFTSSQFTGSGVRFMFLVRKELGSAISIWSKLGSTIYDDGRQEIGSGGEIIIGRKSSFLKVECRIKL